MLPDAAPPCKCMGLAGPQPPPPRQRNSWHPEVLRCENRSARGLLVRLQGLAAFGTGPPVAPSAAALEGARSMPRDKLWQSHVVDVGSVLNFSEVWWVGPKFSRPSAARVDREGGLVLGAPRLAC